MWWRYYTIQLGILFLLYFIVIISKHSTMQFLFCKWINRQKKGRIHLVCLRKKTQRNGTTLWNCSFPEPTHSKNSLISYHPTSNWWPATQPLKRTVSAEFAKECRWFSVGRCALQTDLLIPRYFSGRTTWARLFHHPCEQRYSSLLSVHFPFL